MNVNMLRALSLADISLGSVSPNPNVGAVVVNGSKVVGEGSTQPPGQDHAEIVALRHAAGKTKGAVLYTTLEPCAHEGRTPPCTSAIVAAGISKVCVAIEDPNPLVSGKGLDCLREAGIEVVLGDGAQKAKIVTESYLKFITTKLPFVTAKFAMSLDGKIATRSSDSKWITNEKSRRYVHEMRSKSDAIITGINTVLTDDPLFTARDEKGIPLNRQPLRIVVDSSGRIPTSAKFFSECSRSLVAVNNIDEHIMNNLSRVADVLEVPNSGDGLVDINDLLIRLGKLDITSLIIESGGTLLGSFFDLKLVDKVVAFVSPIILGGVNSPTAVAGLGVDKISDAFRLKHVQLREFDGDLLLTGYCN